MYIYACTQIQTLRGRQTIPTYIHVLDEYDTKTAYSMRVLGYVHIHLQLLSSCGQYMYA